MSELLNVLAPKGAEMLVNGIRNRVFVPPLKEIHSRAPDNLTHAAKITPEDRHIDWQKWTWIEISRRQRVLNPLWGKALVPTQKTGDHAKDFQWKRIIFDEIENISEDSVPGSKWLALLPGVPFIPSHVRKGQRALYIYTVDGQLLRLGKLKVEGEKFNDALIAAQKARMFSPNKVRFTDAEFSIFNNPIC